MEHNVPSLWHSLFCTGGCNSLHFHLGLSLDGRLEDGGQGWAGGGGGRRSGGDDSLRVADWLEADLQSRLLGLTA